MSDQQLSLTEIGALKTPPPLLRDNGLEDLLERRLWAGLREYERFGEEAFAHFSKRGGYPSVQRNKDTGLLNSG